MKSLIISILGTFILSVVLLTQALGQGDYTYEVEVIDNHSSLSPEAYEKVTNARDSSEFHRMVQDEIIDLWSRSFLTASLDTIISDKGHIIAKIFIGEEYRFGEVRLSDQDMALVSAAGLKNVRWKDKALSADLLGEYAENMLTYLEQNGHPFAKVGLDSVAFVDGALNAHLNVSRHRYVPFDSLAIVGKVDIRQSFLSRYLNIRAEDAYDRSKINNIEKRIGDLTFVELDSTPIIKFANNTAQVHLYLKPKKASRFDFLIGILPSSDNGERRFSIIGEFTGEMYNKLGQGEYIFANVQSRPETKVLDVRFSYPYLFDLPLGIDMKGGIFFNEQFRETTWNAGILYQFDGASSLKASWNNKTSRLIDVDTTSILAAGILPNQLDISYNGGGLEYAYRNLDYRFNPSKGWEVKASGTVGLKKVLRNNTIENLSRPELDFVAAYDTIKLSTLQTEAKISAAFYFPTFDIGTIKLGLEGGIQFNEEKIYENEQYRIGGNALLRGFDELSVLTSTYIVNTLEFRLLLDRNSYLSFPFVDYGITKIILEDEEQWDTALSLGMGINFSTPAGIFNVSFAAGRRLDNPFDFGNTKIHFGYVSLF